MNKTLFKEFLEDIPEIDTQKEVLVITDMDFFDYIRSHKKEVQDEYQDEDIDEFFQILLEEDVPDFDNYNIRIETQLREDLHRAVLKKTGLPFVAQLPFEAWFYDYDYFDLFLGYDDLYDCLHNVNNYYINASGKLSTIFTIDDFDSPEMYEEYNNSVRNEEPVFIYYI